MLAGVFVGAAHGALEHERDTGYFIATTQLGSRLLVAPWHRAQPVQQPEYCTRTAEKLKLAWPNLRGPDVVDVLLSFRNFHIRSILTHTSHQ